MYQECLKLVFKSVSRVVKGSFMGVSIAFVFIEVIASTRAYGGLVKEFQGCSKNDSRIFQGCLMGVSWMFQGCLKGYFWVFTESVSGILQQSTGLFQVYF